MDHENSLKERFRTYCLCVCHKYKLSTEVLNIVRNELIIEIVNFHNLKKYHNRLAQQCTERSHFSGIENYTHSKNRLFSKQYF